MDVRLLETLVWVVRLGGIGAAARHLNLTQPTVTRRIQELEASLHARLLERDGRNAVPTAAGLRGVAYAERVLAEIASMRVAVGDRSGLQGAIRLGVVELVALTWLDRLLHRITTAYPNVTVQIDVDLSSRLIGKLGRRQLDLIMVPGAVTLPGVAKVPLGSIAFRWMASPSLLPERDITAEELAALPILSMPPEADAHDTMTTWFATLGLRPTRVSHCSSFSVVASLVRKGVGVSLMPVDLLSDDLLSGRLVAVVERPRVPRPEYSAAYVPAADAQLMSEIAGLAQRESWAAPIDVTGL